MSRSLAEHKDRLARHRSSASVDQFVWCVDRIVKSRFPGAEEFIAAGAPGEVRMVFLRAGAVGASRACSDAIKRFIPSVEGDRTCAEAYLASIMRGGVHGLDLGRQSPSESDDPSTLAMRAAEELDARTTSLQLGSAYHAPYNPATFRGQEDKWKGVTTRSPATAGASTTSVAQPQPHFSSSNSPSDGHSSGHISTAQEVTFRQARLVPVTPFSSDPLAHKGVEASDVPVGSDGLLAVRDARRQEALMLLEGNMEPDTGYDRVLPMREDLVVLLKDETSSITLSELAGAYKSGDFHADNAQEPFDEVEDRFLELLVTDHPTPTELQNSVRAELKTWFAKHDPAVDLSIFAPILGQSSLRASSQVALAGIQGGTDLVLAVGCQEGVDNESYEWVVGKLCRLGKPDGKSSSRTGRIQFKKLLAEVMVAHTSQPLIQQTGHNPFENPSTTAEAVLPYIAAHLNLNTSARFLIIDFAQRHIPAILALRVILGRKRFKIAAITRAERQTPLSRATEPEIPPVTSPSRPCPGLSPLASNPPARLSFTGADWKVEIETAAEATEILSFETKVWRVLREASEWYNPGAEDRDEESGNRISMAVTTERKTEAPPVVKRPTSTAKRPEGYELGRSNFFRPLVPVSPPDSIPASPDAGPRPQGRHTASAPAPASPEPTIGSPASGSSGSTWKALTQRLKRSGAPSTAGGGSGNRLAKKLSALFSPPPPPQPPAPGKTLARGGHISSPVPVAAAPRAAPTTGPVAAALLPPPPRQYITGTAAANAGAQATGSDNDGGGGGGGGGEERDDDMDEEERRLLGRFESRRRRDKKEDDDKARRTLGLP